MVQKCPYGPKKSKIVKTSWFTILTLLYPFGPLWNVEKPATPSRFPGLVERMNIKLLSVIKCFTTHYSQEMSVESDYTKQYNIALEQSRNRTKT